MKNKIKSITCGDLHGSDIWKNINPNNYDKIIFIGDYVDSFTVSNIIMKHNLLDIIQFKKDNMDKVILLIGNHDQQYISGNPNQRCSGFRPEMLWDFQDIFRKNKNLFQVAYQIDNYLWTHAGISEEWYKYSAKRQISMCDLENETIADQLNGLYQYNKQSLFDVGSSRGGIMDVGGILWADKNETSKDPLPDYHQIVGHTNIENIETIKKDDSTSITYIDCLIHKENNKGDSIYFYELEI